MTLVIVQGPPQYFFLLSLSTQNTPKENFFQKLSPGELLFVTIFGKWKDYQSLVVYGYGGTFSLSLYRFVYYTPRHALILEQEHKVKMLDKAKMLCTSVCAFFFCSKQIRKVKTAEEKNSWKQSSKNYGANFYTFLI